MEFVSSGETLGTQAEEELTHRGALMKAATNGDIDAQRELRWRYDVWGYSPGEQDSFVQRRGHL